MTPKPARPQAAHRGGAGRAYLGLALLGWGLSIVLGVTPHEDLVVGSGLAIFGAVLVATSPRLPESRGLPAYAVAGVGLAIVAGVLAHTLLASAAFDVPKAALVALGVGLATAAPFLRRRIPVGRKGRSVTVATLVVGGLAVLGAPLAVWGLQAATKGVMGTTPMEAFVRYGLLLPIGLFLKAVGLDAAIDGQTVTYATPHGPLALEVGAACSGVQAMALFAGVLALFLWIEKPGGRRLALWSAIGIGGVYVANLLRLAMLFLVGYEWGPDALLQAHAQAGWLFFVAWAIVFARLVRSPRRADM
ncbi:MAG: hypothetical protein QOJ26_1127 [Thermoplasmata archaeon]|jgi:exosortase/archaeosortase family protein|nr:hypothetical protein [Thermoplasmata archaeon]MEA3166255.1 hypothetical protein [Thermoplasmata archaeon]